MNSRCSAPGCPRPGAVGLGWGLGTGLVLWYCLDHFEEQLARLARLLDAAAHWRRAA